MTTIKPGYHPNYPEYKWRCGMRCGNIWRCWGPKSFYSKLIRAWYQSKSAQPVLEKLNENPEWSAQKLAEEWHLICNARDESDINLRSIASEEWTPSDDCFLARHPGDFGSTNVCYAFWDWWYFFQFGKKNSAPKRKTAKLADTEYEWSLISCWNNVSIEDLHVLCDRYWIDYVLYKLNKGEIELSGEYVGDNWYIGIDWEKECFCGYYLYTRCLRGGSTKAKREPKGPCWRKRKCSSLLTYEKLKEMYYATPVLAELNSRPEEYFHSLTEHLIQNRENPNLRDLGEPCHSFKDGIMFDTSDNLWISSPCK